MWIEALLTEDDLAKLLGRAFPLKIELGDHHSIDLFELSTVKLVANEGLRAVCKARVHWPILGIELPVVLHSLDVMLRPFIDEGGGKLIFALQLEHADVAGIPTLIDDQLTHAINAQLAAHNHDMGWDFATTLSHVFDLPKMIEPLEAIGLKVAWGKVRISEEGFVLAISFHADVERTDEPHKPSLWRPADEPAPAATLSHTSPNHAGPPADARSLWPEAAILGGAFGTAAGIAFLGLRSMRRH